MAMNGHWRQNVLVILAGSALVVSAVSWSQRHEAVAVPPLPNAQDLSVAFGSGGGIAEHRLHPDDNQTQVGSGARPGDPRR